MPGTDPVRPARTSVISSAEQQPLRIGLAAAFGMQSEVHLYEGMPGAQLSHLAALRRRTLSRIRRCPPRSSRNSLLRTQLCSWVDPVSDGYRQLLRARAEPSCRASACSGSTCVVTRSDAGGIG